MIKVKEWLDTNFFGSGEAVLKENGHYNVGGEYGFPKERKSGEDYISVSINNETIIVGNMNVKGMKNLYNYLQTYEHLERGEPDENGYYKRSTDEEIIRYINTYYEKLIENQYNNIVSAHFFVH